MIKSRRMSWVGHVVCMGDMRNAYKILVGKSEVKIPLRRPRHKCEDNIKMDIMEVGLKVWARLFWFRIRTGGRLL
jgi:hypothetical protein